MKKLLHISISILLLACSEPMKENEESPVKKEVAPVIEKKEVVKAAEEKKVEPIRNKDVVERLTQYGKENPETICLIKTDFGDIKVRLFKDTPLHRASFIMLAKTGCFNNIVFTRVSPQFMAQAGGTYDENTVAKRKEIARYSIPAEILSHHYHKQGALGAARSYNNNPKKRSDAFNFYFVEGSIYNDMTLDKYEEENKYKYPAAHREYYKQNAGAAHIDGQHTVFGEIIEGYSVVPKLTSVKRSSSDWPVTDIYIKEVIVLN